MSKVTRKGQVTIPLAVRERLGIQSGDEVRFEVRGSMAAIVKVEPARRDLKDWYGALGNPKGERSDDIVDAMRGGRP